MGGATAATRRRSADLLASPRVEHSQQQQPANSSGLVFHKLAENDARPTGTAWESPGRGEPTRGTKEKRGRGQSAKSKQKKNIRVSAVKLVSDREGAFGAGSYRSILVHVFVLGLLQGGDSCGGRGGGRGSGGSDSGSCRGSSGLGEVGRGPRVRGHAHAPGRIRTSRVTAGDREVT